jgi:protease I
VKLKAKKIAVLAEDQYEDLELWYPLLRMKEEGAKVTVVGTIDNKVYQSKHGYPVRVEATPNQKIVNDFDAVIIPGGYAPDRMRRDPDLLEMVKHVFERGGLIAMICHAGWVPISAGIVNSKQVTSTPAIKDDLINAGAIWLDQEVVVDGNLISSRNPDDLPAFCKAIIATLTDVQETPEE